MQDTVGKYFNKLFHCFGVPCSEPPNDASSEAASVDEE